DRAAIFSTHRESALVRGAAVAVHRRRTRANSLSPIRSAEGRTSARGPAALAIRAGAAAMRHNSAIRPLRDRAASASHATVGVLPHNVPMRNALCIHSYGEC